MNFFKFLKAFLGSFLTIGYKWPDVTGYRGSKNDVTYEGLKIRWLSIWFVSYRCTEINYYLYRKSADFGKGQKTVRKALMDSGVHCT